MAVQAPQVLFENYFAKIRGLRIWDSFETVLKKTEKTSNNYFWSLDFKNVGKILVINNLIIYSFLGQHTQI